MLRSESTTLLVYMSNIYRKVCPHSDLIKSITVWILQIKQYLGCGGLLFKTPATKEQILGCSPLISLEYGHEKQILQTYNHL